MVLGPGKKFGFPLFLHIYPVFVLSIKDYLYVACLIVFFDFLALSLAAPKVVASWMVLL